MLPRGAGFEPIISMHAVSLVLGLIIGAIGLYLLFVSPSAGGDIVNLHRLMLGVTFAISGSIFIAAGLTRR